MQNSLARGESAKMPSDQDVPFVHDKKKESRALWISWSKYLFIALTGGIFFLAYHWVELSTGFQFASGNRGDTRFVTWTLEHGWLALKGQQSWRDPSIFFPKTGTLGYSDALAGLVPIYGLFRSLGLGLFQSAAAMVVFCDALSAIAMFLFMSRVLRLGLLSSALGTLIFCFNSPKLQQLDHWQLQPLFMLPLISGGICLWWQRRWKWGLTVAGFILGIQFSTSFYIAWFFTLILLIWGVVLFAKREWRSEMLRVAPIHSVGERRVLFFSIAVSVVSLIPFLWIYWPALRELPQRQYAEVFPMVPRLHSWLWMGDSNWLWGRLARWLPFHELPLYWEHQIGVGAFLSVSWLLIVGSTFMRPKFTPYKIRAAVIGLLLINLIALKIPGAGSPWYLVYKLIPGAKGIRAVSRYVIVWLFPFSILIGWFWQTFITQKLASFAKTLFFALVVVTLFGVEQFGSVQNYSLKSESERMEKLRDEAGSLLRGCLSFYALQGPGVNIPPWELHVDAMLLSAMIGLPTLNGYSGANPPKWDLWQAENKNHASMKAEQWLKLNGVSQSSCIFEVKI